MDRGGRLFLVAEYHKIMQEVGFKFAGIVGGTIYATKTTEEFLKLPTKQQQYEFAGKEILKATAFGIGAKAGFESMGQTEYVIEKRSFKEVEPRIYSPKDIKLGKVRTYRTFEAKTIEPGELLISKRFKSFRWLPGRSETADVLIRFDRPGILNYLLTQQGSTGKGQYTISTRSLKVLKEPFGLKIDTKTLKGFKGEYFTEVLSGGSALYKIKYALPLSKTETGVVEAIGLAQKPAITELEQTFERPFAIGEPVGVKVGTEFGPYRESMTNVFLKVTGAKVKPSKSVGGPTLFTTSDLELPFVSEKSFWKIRAPTYGAVFGQNIPLVVRGTGKELLLGDAAVKGLPSAVLREKPGSYEPYHLEFTKTKEFVFKKIQEKFEGYYAPKTGEIALNINLEQERIEPVLRHEFAHMLTIKKLGKAELEAAGGELKSLIRKTPFFKQQVRKGEEIYFFKKYFPEYYKSKLSQAREYPAKIAELFPSELEKPTTLTGTFLKKQIGDYQLELSEKTKSFFYPFVKKYGYIDYAPYRVEKISRGFEQLEVKGGERLFKISPIGTTFYPQTMYIQWKEIPVGKPFIKIGKPKSTPKPKTPIDRVESEPTKTFTTKPTKSRVFTREPTKLPSIDQIKSSLQKLKLADKAIQKTSQTPFFDIPTPIVNAEVPIPQSIKLSPDKIGVLGLTKIAQTQISKNKQLESQALKMRQELNIKQRTKQLQNLKLKTKNLQNLKLKIKQVQLLQQKQLQQQQLKQQTTKFFVPTLPPIIPPPMKLGLLEKQKKKTFGTKGKTFKGTSRYSPQLFAVFGGIKAKRGTIKTTGLSGAELRPILS